MGNRCIIKSISNQDIQLYLHWNGGIESVLGFLEAFKKLREMTKLETSESPYRFTTLFHFATMIQNWCKGSSINIEKYYEDDNNEVNISQDNGNYYIDLVNFKITTRIYLEYTQIGDKKNDFKKEIITIQGDDLQKQIDDLSVDDKEKMEMVAKEVFEVNSKIYFPNATTNEMDKIISDMKSVSFDNAIYQNTGLLDINNKPVLRGSIVKIIDNSSLRRVNQESTYLVDWSEDNASFVLRCQSPNHPDYDIYGLCDIEMEII